MRPHSLCSPTRTLFTTSQDAATGNTAGTSPATLFVTVHWRPQRQERHALNMTAQLLVPLS
jgi:hypothetical protein